MTLWHSFWLGGGKVPPLNQHLLVRPFQQGHVWVSLDWRVKMASFYVGALQGVDQLWWTQNGVHAGQLWEGTYGLSTASRVHLYKQAKGSHRHSCDPGSWEISITASKCRCVKKFTILILSSVRLRVKSCFCSGNSNGGQNIVVLSGNYEGNKKGKRNDKYWCWRKVVRIGFCGLLNHAQQGSKQLGTLNFETKQGRRSQHHCGKFLPWPM